MAVAVQAQSLPEAARKERERQAQQKKAAPAIKSEDIKSNAPAAPAGANIKPVAKPVVVPNLKTPPPPKEDPVKKYNDDVAKLKLKISQLEDQERSSELAINDLKNQFTAPVADSGSRDQIQTKLDTEQKKLPTIQNDLAVAKKQLTAMETQGPPKKP